MDKSAKLRTVWSVVLTLVVIGLYLIPNFASAVTLYVTSEKQTYTDRDIVTFDVALDIEQSGIDDVVPIRNLTLTINNTIKQCTFTLDGAFLTDGCRNMRITPKMVVRDTYQYVNFSDSILSGTGYGYGMLSIEVPKLDLKNQEFTNGFEEKNWPFFTGYGYGYAAGYGYGLQYPSEFTYTVQWDAQSDGIGPGDYEARLEAIVDNKGTFQIWEDIFANFFSHFRYVSEEPTLFTITEFVEPGPTILNLNNLCLRVRGSTVFDNLNGVQPITVTRGTCSGPVLETVLEFNWDLSRADTNALLSNVERAEVVENGVAKVLVRGLSVPKTVYMTKVNTTTNGVCIKDAIINAFSDISNDCTGNAEFKVVCDGTSRNGYICSEVNGRLVLQGLNHSGVSQFNVVSPPPGDPPGDTGGGRRRITPQQTPQPRSPTPTTPQPQVNPQAQPSGGTPVPGNQESGQNTPPDQQTTGTGLGGVTGAATGTPNTNAITGSAIRNILSKNSNKVIAAGVLLGLGALGVVGYRKIYCNR